MPNINLSLPLLRLKRARTLTLRWRQKAVGWSATKSRKVQMQPGGWWRRRRRRGGDLSIGSLPLSQVFLVFFGDLPSPRNRLKSNSKRLYAAKKLSDQ